MTGVTGSLFNRKGVWYTMICYPDECGKRKQKPQTTGIRVESKSKREMKNNKHQAEEILKVRLAEFTGECVTFNENSYLLSYLEDWLDAYKESVRENTILSYWSYYNVHIKPYFVQKGLSRLKVSELNVRHLEAYRREKHAQGLSYKSIKKHLRVFNGALKRAMREEIITRNPVELMEKVRIPASEKPHKKAYAPEQAAQLIKAVKGNGIEVPVMLALYLGLRREECVGLRWQDVDFENGIIHICNTVTSSFVLVEAEQTKSEASRRDIPMSNELQKYLLGVRNHQEEMKLLYGNTYKENIHVCRHNDGGAMRPDFVTRKFKEFLKKNDFPEITFHELRHTAGSILFNEGVSAKQIQQLLGHSDVSTTMDIYTHLTTITQRKTTDTISNLITPKGA